MGMMEGQPIPPADMNVFALPSNPTASRNCYFPVAADETRFVSLDFISVEKKLRLKD